MGDTDGAGDLGDRQVGPLEQEACGAHPTVGQVFVERNTDGLLEKRFVVTGDSTDGYMTPVLSGLSEMDFIAFPYGKQVVEGAPTVEGTWEDLYG